MSLYNLNRLRHFVEVVESGSFTAAAKKLGLGKAIVSHQVAKLEEELGAGLLVRTTRSLQMTEAGQRFYENAAEILAQAERAVQELQQEQEIPSGLLTVTAPEDYGQCVVARALMRLRAKYPKIKVNAVFTDEKLDQLKEKIDVSIRVGWLEDSSAIARKIGSFQQYTVASPQYVEAMGPITTPMDLQDKDWIYHCKLPAGISWQSAEGEEVQFVLQNPPITVWNTLTSHACALGHGGLCLLPSFQIREDLASGRLQRVLPDWHHKEGGIYALFPNSRFRPAKTKVFVEELIKAHKEVRDVF
ncbi:LysR family transcriptional regulator [Pseudovibrio ascidiaceicola]|uniref:LysR family transcriptional regulator n=1 Tax=Pseudovibrio ascidiaceicola TaxID=285279 RepID=UPI000D68F1AC|nr:LysR family transcriptional regulator [Pseudovibrio ascidiaceicola]